MNNDDKSTIDEYCYTDEYYRELDAKLPPIIDYDAVILAAKEGRIREGIRMISILISRI